MIDKGELRIYNWVCVTPDSEHKINCKVYSLDYGVCMAGDAFYPYGDLFPIELTVPIVKRFGFISKDGRYYVLKSNPRLGWDSKTHNMIVGYADSGKRVNYLHQLQNIIYDLTNQELSINIKADED